LSSMGWSSNAQAVNADGSVIVGSVAIDGDAVPFRWSAREGIVLLSSARGPNNRSVAKGVSADGAVIVGNAKGPFRWTAASGMKLMDGGFLSYVNGLSADGSRAIGWSHAVPGDEDHSVAVYWDADGHMYSIGRYRNSGMAMATAVSANGQWVAGFAQDDSAEHHNVAFLWSEQTGFQTLGWLHSGGFARAYGINSDGSVVVGSATDGAYHRNGTGFRWTRESGMQSITEWVQTGGGRITRSLVRQASGVSGDGNTVVGFLHDDDPFVAVVPHR
jgi:probable HAF family extracellular repeat protein